MRILFYLPVITNRHFDSVVLPLIRVMVKGGAEVHVAGPLQWNSTGISQHQLERTLDLPEIRWHILDGDDFASLRTAPTDPEALVAFVAGLAPDITLCRSADTATPSRFPGATRFMMEPIIPPFALRPGIRGGMTFDGPRLYDQGFLPDLDGEERERIDQLFGPCWQAMRARHDGGGEDARAAYLAEAGLPADRRIIALPLNVEAATNHFIAVHSATPSNARLIAELATTLDDDCVLALTKHPLNLHGDPELDRSVEPIEPVVATLGDRVKIVTAPGPAGNATASLLRHCDGAVLCDSKSFGYAAFFGKPMLRRSRYDSAPWLHAYTEAAEFQAALRDGSARAATEADARTWFGFHYANNVFAADDPALTAHEVVDRVRRTVNPERWEAGIARISVG